MLGNRRYCYPLTITDFASRYLLTCEALSTTQETLRLHRVRADVQGIWAAAGRSGPTTACPFASAHALYGLSKLAVWWLRLGIADRADQTRSSATERPTRADASDAQEGSDQAGRANVLQQQARFDTFVEQYNHERPHQALGDESPGRRLRAFTARLPRPGGPHVPVSRSDDRRDAAAAGSASKGGRSISATCLPARTSA